VEAVDVEVDAVDVVHQDHFQVPALWRSSVDEREQHEMHVQFTHFDGDSLNGSPESWQFPTCEIRPIGLS
jgi:hypothetical protein